MVCFNRTLERFPQIVRFVWGWWERSFELWCKPNKQTVVCLKTDMLRLSPLSFGNTITQVLRGKGTASLMSGLMDVCGCDRLWVCIGVRTANASSVSIRTCQATRSLMALCPSVPARGVVQRTFLRLQEPGDTVCMDGHRCFNNVPFQI